MKAMVVNLNAVIRVTLNPDGLWLWWQFDTAILGKMQALNPKDYAERQEKNGGFVEFSLWDFMNIFGPHYSIGGAPLTEGNQIVIPLNDYTAVVKE